jgi:hypothetical protein
MARRASTYSIGVGLGEILNSGDPALTESPTLNRTSATMPGMVDRLTVAHEYVHAMQDQQFDLSRARAVLDEDQSLAFHAVIEGDAVLAVDAYVDASAPPELRLLSRSVRSPGKWGWKRRKRGAWKGHSRTPLLSDPMQKVAVQRSRELIQETAFDIS